MGDTVTVNVTDDEGTIVIYHDKKITETGIKRDAYLAMANSFDENNLFVLALQTTLIQQL